MKFVDLFAGMGGFHRALAALGHECVFASELDEELRELYVKNYKVSAKVVHGDIREAKSRVPAHDILCAGFPCQPFSKSGTQSGLKDKTRGTLFHEIVDILKVHRPRYVILENVGNFERHDGGRTWQTIKDELEALGYNVRGTTHFGSGGHGLISPHHFGHPHHRERFFIVGSLNTLEEDPFPKGNRDRETSLLDIVENNGDLVSSAKAESSLTAQQVDCIDHWNTFVRAFPQEHSLPSFPIWSDEFGATYPFEEVTPWNSPRRALHRLLTGTPMNGRRTWEDITPLLPSYARSEEPAFPDWKKRFIRSNRSFYKAYRPQLDLPSTWLKRLREFPSSLRKLEWNDKTGPRDLWKCVLQFRPSGLRAKRYNASPALVAMTTTQIPILGPKRRYITRVEGLRLQGFPDKHQLPASHQAAFKALGNAVHVDVVKRIAKAILRAGHNSHPL